VEIEVSHDRLSPLGHGRIGGKCATVANDGAEQGADGGIADKPLYHLLKTIGAATNCRASKRSQEVF
jgi:hypothetical protein